jgi:hypothetical protein
MVTSTTTRLVVVLALGAVLALAWLAARVRRAVSDAMQGEQAVSVRMTSQAISASDGASLLLRSFERGKNSEEVTLFSAEGTKLVRRGTLPAEAKSISARGNQWVAITDDKLLESDDAGARWREADAPPIPPRRVQFPPGSPFNLGDPALVPGKLADVQIDADGTVWLASATRVWARRSGGWQPLDGAPELRLVGDGSAALDGGFARLYLGDERGDVIIAAELAGALRFRNQAWTELAQGIVHTPGPAGYWPESNDALQIGRRGRAIVAATHSGFYTWSEREATWQRWGAVFRPVGAGEGAPEWVHGINRSISTMVRGLVPSPWSEDEWLVAGAAGIVAVGGKEPRWVWRPSREQPAIVTSMAAGRGGIWAGLSPATPKAAALLLRESGAEFIGLQ